MHAVGMDDTSRPFSFSSFSGCFGAAHDSAGTVYSAVKCLTTFFGIDALEYDGYITHATTDIAELTGGSGGGSFSHDDAFFSAVILFPGIVVMIVDLKCGFSTKYVEYVVNNDISSGIGIFSSKLHRLEVHFT